MDQFRVGALVGEARDLHRQQPPGGGVGGRVGEREADPLVVVDPAAALLALQRPADRLLEQPPHRPDPVGGDPEPLLGEPEPLQLFAAADPADHRVAGTSTESKRIVGWPSG